MIARVWRTLLAGFLFAGASCSTLPIAPRGPLDEEAAYTTMYPYYIEFCALSEVQKIPGYGADIRGGIGGHSTVYLNGACLVGPGYPELKLCDASAPSDGVGLSVNAHFANANWAAIPGREFFYHGDLKPGQKLTRAIYDATKAHAKRLGLYDAIRFHPVVFNDMPAGYSQDAYKYEVSIATDYALGYGRDRYCARVPMSAAHMTHIVDYLNALNRPYRNGSAEFDWGVLTDNCIHLAHNALTAIGFWPLWPTHQFVLFAAFDFPVPKNEFVNILRRANDEPIADLQAMWRDRPTRQAVLDGDGLPTRDGALAVLEPATRDSDVYKTNHLRLIFYDEPTFGPYEGWWRDILAMPRYTDMKANHARFATLYAQIRSERRPLAWWREHHSDLADAADFATFYARYYETVERRAAALAAGLRG